MREVSEAQLPAAVGGRHVWSCEEDVPSSKMRSCLLPLTFWQLLLRWRGVVLAWVG